MSFIYLHKLELPEKVRVNPDDIRMIEPMEGVKGSFITFTNNDEMRYDESPQEIEWKERRVRFLRPNVEKLFTAFLGGMVGALVTLLFRSNAH